MTVSETYKLEQENKRLKDELEVTQDLYVKHVVNNVDMEAEHEYFKQKLEKIKELIKIDDVTGTLMIGVSDEPILKEILDSQESKE